MRIFAFVLIALGLGLALLMPATVDNSDFEEISRVDLSALSQSGSAEAVFDLKETDSTVRFQLQAEPTAGLDGTIAVIAKISDRSGSLIGGIVSFESATPDRPIDASQPLDFDVVHAGDHAITLAFADRNQRSMRELGRITAIFYRNISDIEIGFAILGYPLAVLGFYLLMRSRRQKNATKKIRWGRGE